LFQALKKKGATQSVLRQNGTYSLPSPDMSRGAPRTSDYQTADWLQDMYLSQHARIR